MRFHAHRRRARRGMSHARPRAEATCPRCPGGTMRNHLTILCVIASTLALAACTEGTASRGIAPVSLALSSAGSTTAPAAAPAAASETFTDGTNTLVISSVEVVLRKEELKRAEAADGWATSTSGIAATAGGWGGPWYCAPREGPPRVCVEAD